MCPRLLEEYFGLVLILGIETIKNDKLIQIVVMETRFSLRQLLSLLRLIKVFDTMKLERRIGLYKYIGRRHLG